MSRVPSALQSFFDGYGPVSFVCSVDVQNSSSLSSLGTLYASKASTPATATTGWRRDRNINPRVPSDEMVISVHSSACDIARRRLESACKAVAVGLDDNGEPFVVPPVLAPSAVAARTFEELMRSGVAPDSSITAAAINIFAAAGMGLRAIDIMATSAVVGYEIAILAGLSIQAARSRALDVATSAEVVIAALASVGLEGRADLVTWIFDAYTRIGKEKSSATRLEGGTLAYVPVERNSVDFLVGLAAHTRVVSAFCTSLAAAVENVAVSHAAPSKGHSPALIAASEAPIRAADALRELLDETGSSGAHIPVDTLAALAILTRATGSRASSRHMLSSAFIDNESSAGGASAVDAASLPFEAADLGGLLALTWAAAGVGGGVHLRAHQLRISDVVYATVSASPSEEDWPSPSCVALAEAAWIAAHAVRGDKAAEMASMKEAAISRGHMMALTASPNSSASAASPPRATRDQIVPAPGDLSHIPLSKVVCVIAGGVMSKHAIVAASNLSEPANALFTEGSAHANVAIGSLLARGDLSAALAQYFKILPAPAPVSARLQPFPETVTGILTAIAVDTGALGSSLSTSPLLVHPSLVNEQLEATENVSERVCVDSAVRRLALVSNVLLAASARGVRPRVCDVSAVAEVLGAIGNARLARQDIINGSWGVDGAALIYAATLRGLSRSGVSRETAVTDCDWLAARAAEDGVITSLQVGSLMAGVISDAVALLDAYVADDDKHKSDAIADAAADYGAFSPATRAKAPRWSPYVSWATSKEAAAAFVDAANMGKFGADAASSIKSMSAPSASAVSVASSAPHISYTRAPLAHIVSRLRLLHMSTESPLIAAKRLYFGRGALSKAARVAFEAILARANELRASQSAPPTTSRAGESTNVLSTVSPAAFASVPVPQPAAPARPLYAAQISTGQVTSVGGFFFVSSSSSAVDDHAANPRLIQPRAWANERLSSLLPGGVAAAAAVAAASAPSAATALDDTANKFARKEESEKQKSDIVSLYLEPHPTTVSAAAVARQLSAPAWRFAEAGAVGTDAVQINSRSTRHKTSFAAQ